MSLWNTPADPKVLDKLLGEFKLDASITPEKLERSFKEKQEKCKHDLQRFGPSYTARDDGSQKEFDESICLKCGYQPEKQY